ncbi:MAG: DUF5703 domain-containing protein [Verrucomicrobiae bacterium]|nr:DUF5703 domain-containing protein [Verrucomicrobiae bacterium]
MPVRVEWNTPSADSSGSMPLGNGEVGINFWVEDAGSCTDIVFYIARTDAWDENGRLCKLGRVRVRIEVPPRPFRQVLDLERGCVEVQFGPVRLVGWVDAHAPVVCVEGNSDQPVRLRAAVELWRTTSRVITSTTEARSFLARDAEHEVIRTLPDTVLRGQPDRVVWCHHNATSCWADMMRHQELASLIPHFEDPLLHRTFGGVLSGTGLVRDGELGLVSREPMREFRVTVHTHTAQAATVDEWLAGVVFALPNREAHERWWRAFWQRSWIRVTGDEDAEIVTRGYALQRYLNGCAGRGAYPIKFNGSLFTVDAREAGEELDADYRRWGGAYWFQNTRLIYWPMLMSGDFDLIQPWYRMYCDALPFATARVREYFGHGGAMFPETMTFWGAYRNGDYGYNREGLPRGVPANSYIRYYWQGGLELIAHMLDYRDFTGEVTVLQELAHPIIEFYDQHFPRIDARGYRVFEPAQSLETWQEAVNPLPDIAGLRFVLARTKGWENLRAQLPPLPQRREVWTKKRYLIPAAQYDICANSENPELYAVFPYRLFGVGLSDLDVGRETYARRAHRGTGCWRQDAIHAACLGLTEEARRYVIENFRTKDAGSRFEGFVGPNYDWVPDVDHGGVAMTALQRMLLQYHDDRLLLLPAWPRNWDVHFKLHAPFQTTVEATVRGGKLASLVVSPPSRRANVEMMWS